MLKLENNYITFTLLTGFILLQYLKAPRFFFHSETWPFTLNTVVRFTSTGKNDGSLNLVCKKNPSSHLMLFAEGTCTWQ